MNTQNPNSPLLCGDYQRFSSKQQANNSSLETQLKFNLDLIQKIGGKHVGSFVDKAQSAYSRVASKRPAIADLVKAIESGEINCVVFYDESRLSRQIIDFYVDVYYPIINVNPNVQFYKSSTGSKWDPMSAEAKQNLIQACTESHKKVSTSRNAQAVKLHNKQRPGSSLPLGISYAGEDLIPDEYFPLVLLIFQMASWGYSERAIAEHLRCLETNDNFKSPLGRKWMHTSIHHILYNRLYIGEHTWDRRISKHNSSKKSVMDPPFMLSKPLVPISLWNLAHEELQRKRSKTGSRMQTNFLLSSKVECGICSTILLTKNSTKKGTNVKKLKTKLGKPLRYYYCPYCNYRVNSETLDTTVVGRLNNELKTYVSKTIIKNKIKEWKSALHKLKEDKIIENELLLIKGQMIEQFDNDKYTVIYKQLRSIARQVISKCKEEIEDINNLIYQLDKYNNETIIDVMLNRIHSKIFGLSLTERRYIAISAIEKISVRPTIQNLDNFQIDTLSYKKIPIPFFDSQLDV